jgi:NAD(P)-dependent dehydrogenase (short-subunit alcohol dehydrogenase family)
MMKDFAGKVLFITGGASGAGFGQAKVFSEAGCKVVIADIRQDHLDEAMAYFKEKKADALQYGRCQCLRSGGSLDL